MMDGSPLSPFFFLILNYRRAFHGYTSTKLLRGGSGEVGGGCFLMTKNKSGAKSKKIVAWLELGGWEEMGLF